MGKQINQALNGRIVLLDQSWPKEKKRHELACICSLDVLYFTLEIITYVV